MSWKLVAKTMYSYWWRNQRTTNV